MSDLTKPQAEILEAVRRLKRYGEIPTLSEVAKLLKKISFGSIRSNASFVAEGVNPVWGKTAHY